MSDLRRPLVTIVFLAALCTLVGVFVFPGPSQPPLRGLSAITRLGTVAPQPVQPVATQSPSQGVAAVAGPAQVAPGPTSFGGSSTTNATPPPTTTSTTTTTTSAPAAVPADSGSDCGGAPPDIASSGQPWTCTFDDEFNGSSLDPTKWIAQQTSDSGYHSGNECYVNSPNNVSVSGGTLNLTVRAEAAPFLCPDPFGDYLTQYTSGMVSTYHRFSQTYGLFEVRAKFPADTVPGVQTTLWLWPVNSKAYGLLWPDSGEIDFAEWYSEYSGIDIPIVHYNRAIGATDTNTAHCALPAPDTFHTYGLEWTPTSLTILLDGNVCMVDDWQPALPLSKPEPFDRPFIMSLTQALGIQTNNFNPASTPLPATTQIDWVRVWS